MDADYPRLLTEEFPEIFPGDIHEAVAWSDGSYYFLQGEKVLRNDPVTHQVAPGYPRPLPIDTAHHWLRFL